MNFEEFASSLTPEQIEKSKACTSPQELVALAQKEGVEIPDELLDGIVGGRNIWDDYIIVLGDPREDFDESRIPEAYANGEDLGD